MRSIKFNRLKLNRELVSKSMELQEKGLAKNKLNVLGKSNSRDIFERKRKSIATESQAEECEQEQVPLRKNDFIRYKTESIKQEKRVRYNNVSIDNIFKSHCRRKSVGRKGLF